MADNDEWLMQGLEKVALEADFKGHIPSIWTTASDDDGGPVIQRQANPFADLQNEVQQHKAEKQDIYSQLMDKAQDVAGLQQELYAAASLGNQDEAQLALDDLKSRVNLHLEDEAQLKDEVENMAEDTTRLIDQFQQKGAARNDKYKPKESDQVHSFEHRVTELKKGMEVMTPNGPGKIEDISEDERTAYVRLERGYSLRPFRVNRLSKLAGKPTYQVVRGQDVADGQRYVSFIDKNTCVQAIKAGLNDEDWQVKGDSIGMPGGGRMSVRNTPAPESWNVVEASKKTASVADYPVGSMYEGQKVEENDGTGLVLETGEWIDASELEPGYESPFAKLKREREEQYAKEEAEDEQWFKDNPDEEPPISADEVYNKDDEDEEEIDEGDVSELMDRGADWIADHPGASKSEMQGAAQDMAERPGESDYIYQGMLNKDAKVKKTANNKIQTEPDACPICLSKNGSIVDASTGKPPFHKSCRCREIPMNQDAQPQTVEAALEAAFGSVDLSKGTDDKKASPATKALTDEKKPRVQP